MGQSASVHSRSASCRRLRRPPSSCTPAAPMVSDVVPSSSSEPDLDDSGCSSRDYTLDLPDECLAMVFQSLCSGDRKSCSLVCRRWLVVDGQSRHRLSLEARAALLQSAPALFARFDAVSKLALKCHRGSDSIGDEALALISSRCPNLVRLKLRACREVSEAGMAALAKNCPRLSKLSCGSCNFGSKGINAVLSHCSHLEELSVKRLRGLIDDPVGGPSLSAASPLRSICLKELYNGQTFVPLIAASRGLRTLKLFRCSGDWDKLLEEISISDRVPGLVEVHFEKIQLSDRGLSALSSCVDLEVLHLVKTPECTDVGLASVAERCRLLRKIHIDGWKTNRIGDVGLAAIARRCPNLQELVLIGVNPTVTSLGLIAGSCRNLERLALCGSETIGDAEISCIASKCLALKKLCIKGCPVSNQGMEALAGGCPNLMKVKVKKCKGVTAEGADWLRAIRRTLAVNLDAAGAVQVIEQLDASASESGLQENEQGQFPLMVEQIPALDLPSTSSGRSASSRARLAFFSGRKFMTSAFRRWSNGRNDQHHL
uniref:F-box protein At1g47056 n=1 Tax=Anthurium amnicola TaxID=1678845 RepID=A0A1D1Y6R0_9ARAE